MAFGIPEPVGLPPQLRYSDIGLKKQLRREVAQRDDDGRVDEGQLPFQVGATGRDLIGPWIAVLRRTALDHVGDVAVGPIHAQFLGQQAVQQLSRPAHERESLLVLPGTGALAHEHQLRAA